MARLNLSRHWKFRRLARALGSPVVARGHLEYLWEAAYEAASDYIGSPADIADAALWTGEPLELVAFLVEAQFLDERAPGEYVVHDLWDYAPPFVRLRWARAHPGERPPWHDPAPIEDRPSHPCGDPALAEQETRTYTGRDGTGRKREEQRRSASRSLPLEPETADDVAPAPRPNVRVLVRLAYELGERYEDEADLKDALKTLAARYSVPYDATSITRALELLVHARVPLWLTDARPARRPLPRKRSA